MWPREQNPVYAQFLAIIQGNLQNPKVPGISSGRRFQQKIVTKLRHVPQEFPGETAQIQHRE
jgi:hypothetical protein